MTKQIEKMTELYCGRCGQKIDLVQGFYSLYYRCSNCTNRLTVHDFEIMDQMPQGDFETDRLIGRVLPVENGVKKIVVRRKRK